MNILTSFFENKTNLTLFIVGIVLILVIACLLITYFIIKKKHKVVKPSYDSNELVHILGGIDNILNIIINNKRVSIILNDNKLVILDEFKKRNISTQLIDNTLKLFVSDDKVIKELSDIKLHEVKK